VLKRQTASSKTVTYSTYKMYFIIFKNNGFFAEWTLRALSEQTNRQYKVMLVNTFGGLSFFTEHSRRLAVVLWWRSLNVKKPEGLWFPGGQFIRTRLSSSLVRRHRVSSESHSLLMMSGLPASVNIQGDYIIFVAGLKPFWSIFKTRL